MRTTFWFLLATVFFAGCYNAPPAGPTPVSIENKVNIEDRQTTPVAPVVPVVPVVPVRPVHPPVIVAPQPPVIVVPPQRPSPPPHHPHHKDGFRLDIQVDGNRIGIENRK